MPYNNTPNDRTDNQILDIYYNDGYHRLTLDEKLRLNKLKINEKLIQQKVNQYL